MIRHLKWQIIVPALIVFCKGTAGASEDPFPPGFSMGTLGSVICEKTMSGSQPWTPAAFYDDTFRFAFAAAGVSYYDAMDNFSERPAYRAAGGGLAAFKRIICKASISHFSFLDTYFEQSGSFSLAVKWCRWFRAGVELNGYRIGIVDGNGTSRASADMGLSVWVPWRYVCVSALCEHLTLESMGVEGGDKPVRLKMGLHSVFHKFGAQGVCIEYLPGLPDPLRFTVGEELVLYKHLGLQVAFSNNPVLISIGCIVEAGRYGLDVSFVNHSVLGWSEGIAAGFYPKIRR
jgi:hypothetical protein